MPATANKPTEVRVLMVCLGNICRSPTAHGVFQKYLENKGLNGVIQVDSAGTGDWHIGEHPDPRAVAAAAERGYAIDQLVARQVVRHDFHDFDYILCMDRTNLRNLKDLCPPAFHSKLQLLLDYGDSSHDTVPDPYYSGDQGFQLVLDLIESACEAFLLHVEQTHFSRDTAEPV